MKHTDRELMQQALEALEDACGNRCNAENNPCWQRDVAEALRERLAREEQPPTGRGADRYFYEAGFWVGQRAAKPAQEEQKPVAHVDHRIHGWPDCFVMEADPPHTSPLYTAPQPREWVGLTGEEIGLLTTGDGWAHLETPVLADFARAIEAKLREKNHG